jgi:transposase
MLIGQDIVDLVHLLNQREVALFHACQYRDLLSYLSLGGIPSRALMEDNLLSFTEFLTDAQDHRNGVWERVFVNPEDHGAFFAKGVFWTPNPYGPIQIQMLPDILLDAVDVCWTTRSAGAPDFELIAESVTDLRLIDALFMHPDSFHPVHMRSDLMYTNDIRELLQDERAGRPEINCEFRGQLVPYSGWKLGPVCKMDYSVDHETTCADRAAMGAVAPAVPAATAQPRSATPRRSHDRGGHPLAAGHRRPVARPAGALRPLADGVLPLSPLAASRRVGTRVGGPAGGGRRAGRVGLGAALPGWHNGARPPARGRGQKGGGEQALGRSRGGFSTKIHLRAEGGGKPITCLLTAGQRHEAPQVPALLERGAVARPGRGRPRLRPERVVGDKGYTGQPTRSYLRRRGIGAVIPRRTTESRRGVRFDRAAYRQRNRVERLINRLKQHRAIATRYEKLEVSYHALLTIACMLLWL